MEDQNITTGNNKKKLIAFLNAITDEDFATARQLAADDLKFKGVLGSRDGADAYFADMEKMKFKYDIQKVVGEGSEVSALLNIPMQGKQILTAGWYHFTDDKIDSIKVIFDPRPLFEKS